MNKIILGMLVAFMCVGCKTESVSEDKVSAENAKFEKPAQTPTTSIGKPGASVKLVTHAQEIPIAINSAVDLSLVTPETTGQLTAVVSTTEGLTQTAGNVEYHFALNSDAGALKLPIDVNAAEAGKHYVNIQVSITDENGATTARSLAFIVWAGQSAKKQADAAIKAADEAEGGVKVLQAEETIKSVE